MKKLIFLGLFTLLSTLIYGQNYQLNSKGAYFSTKLKGYVRDAAFYDDTCYLISGNGSQVLVTNSEGTELTSNFSYLVFNQALKIYADDTYVIILDRDCLRYYTKNAALKYAISLSDDWFRYFWVKNKQEIMLVANNRILVYDYNTRALLRSFTPPYRFTSNNNNFDGFSNDGNKLYDAGTKLITYEFTGGTFRVTDITTPKYKSLIEKDYLACFVGNESLWFNYSDRSKAFFVDANFNNVVKNCSSFLPSSKNPTNEDLEIESGNPLLHVYYSQGKIYVINILSDKVEFYQLE